MFPKPQTLMPYIIGSGGLVQHGASNRVATAATDNHLHGIWPGMFVVKSTTGWIGVKGTETLEGNSTTFASADYVVDKLYDSNMQELALQYLTVAQLETTSAVYYLDVKPIGNLEFNITEDGLGAPIPTATISGSYCPVVIVEPSAPNNYALLDSQQGGSFYLDSSGVTTSTTGCSMQLLGLANVMQNAYNATAGSQRVFRAKVITAGYSQ